MKIPLERFTRVLGYQFSNESLLKEALTHRSVGSHNNERLEFLGDSILNYVIASQLFEKFPDASEGQLSRLRALMVKEKTLAEIARDLDIGNYLFLGSGELKSGGYRRDSILADAVEAIIGAILLDSGIESASTFVSKLFADKLDKLSLEQNLKDPKSLLQEYLQSRKRPLPLYEVISVSGDPHDQNFVVECTIEGMSVTVKGTGSSRRRAEQEAAQMVLQQIKSKTSE